MATQALSEQTLSAAQARRIALAAQGFGRPRPTGTVDRRHVRRVFADVGLVQIDSVNVVVRSQELPLWARLGHHNRETVPAMPHDRYLAPDIERAAALVRDGSLARILRTLPNLPVLWIPA